MSEYSHRDLRAQRDSDRAFWMVVLLCVAGTVFAEVAPVPFAGYLGVTALLAVGAGYLVWSERLLAGYSDDLTHGGVASAGPGFRRAEATAGARGSDDLGRRGGPSPHRRRRPPSSEGTGDLPSGSGSQAPP